MVGLWFVDIRKKYISTGIPNTSATSSSSNFSNMMFLLLTSLLAGVVNGASQRSNFLFIIMDDLRPALGCYGDARAHTPNVDRLARHSVVFDKAYAQQALCAPSRNSLLTGRRPDTLGLYDFYSYWRDVAGNFTSLPQHLRNSGYTTISLGKVFHPGASCNYSDDSPYSWSEAPFHPETERYKDAPVCTERDSPPASNLVCPVRVSSMPNATLPDIETLEAAKSFLNGDRRDPFFLAVGFQKPHIPLKYPKRYLKFHSLKKFSLPDKYEWPSNVSSVAYNPWTDLRRRSDIKELELQCPWGKIPRKYAKKIIQSYYAAVTYVDDLIGELLNELEILKIRNNTIVVLTSDHGWSLGEHAEWAKYSNFEVAVRVPLIISIPRVTFKPGDDLQLSSEEEPSREMLRESKINHRNSMRTVYDTVELLDVFPTIAELAGVAVPMCPRGKFNTTLDLCSEGSSLIPLIQASLARKSASWKNAAISQYPRPGLEPVCKPSSDEPNLQNITIMGYTLRTVRYRYTAWVSFSHVSKKPKWREIIAEELYDHSIDFEEYFNVADHEHFQRIKSDLKNMLMYRVER